jgi:hypothetical protein
MSPKYVELSYVEVTPHRMHSELQLPSHLKDTSVMKMSAQLGTFAYVAPSGRHQRMHGAVQNACSITSISRLGFIGWRLGT